MPDRCASIAGLGWVHKLSYPQHDGARYDQVAAAQRQICNCLRWATTHGPVYQHTVSTAADSHMACMDFAVPFCFAQLNVCLCACVCTWRVHVKSWTDCCTWCAWPLHALQEAIAAGHAFFLSANGVLLCEGPLPVQFLREVSAAELQQLWAGEESLSRPL